MASTSAARRQRRLHSARVTMLAAWAASTSAPSKSTSALGWAPVTRAGSAVDSQGPDHSPGAAIGGLGHQQAGRQPGEEHLGRPQGGAELAEACHRWAGGSAHTGDPANNGTGVMGMAATGSSSGEELTGQHTCATDYDAANRGHGPGVMGDPQLWAALVRLMVELTVGTVVVTPWPSTGSQRLWGGWAPPPRRSAGDPKPVRAR